MSRALALAFLCLLWPALAMAGSCGPREHDGRSYTVCSFDLRRDALRLWWQGPDGMPLGSFRALNQVLQSTGQRLAFAMNGGMYHTNRDPVGFYVEDGKQLRPLVTRAGPGNFGLLPNGVFCIGADTAAVVESRAFAQRSSRCRFASQSGPMLVIEGKLHPRFLVQSTSRHIRNGVGVANDGVTVHFAISEERVTFHEFGRLFRDALKTPNALYFDGKVSRLFAPDLGRSDGGFPMGPIVGVAEPS